MKHVFFRSAILSFISITFFSVNALAHKSITKAKHLCFYAPVADDENFVVVFSHTENRAEAHVSFNGNEGTTGTVKIKNANNELVNKFEIGLVHTPNFSTIDLTEYATGVYAFELTTATAVHVSHITVP